jgi:hypothetical protein
MSRRAQQAVLAVLLAVLAVVAYRNLRPSGATVSDLPTSIAVQPLKIENPSLHLARLDRIRKLEYKGTHRNIFVAAPLPPPPSEAKKEEAKQFGPPPPPPLQVPLTFFGMETDPRSGSRRAFFSDGDDVYIAKVGQVLLKQFRVVQIGNNTTELEELSSGRRATLTMVPPVAAE